jgi:uncharacterized protein (UPF0333 family)
MKLIAFWLLVVLAVLVPATAVVASVTISAPAAGDARRVAVESKGMAKHPQSRASRLSRRSISRPTTAAT